MAGDSFGASIGHGNSLFDAPVAIMKKEEVVEWKLGSKRKGGYVCLRANAKKDSTLKMMERVG